MKKIAAICASALLLAAVLAPSALAAESPDTWGPHASPVERVAWGKEEQGSERSFRLQAETKLNVLCDDVVCYPTSVTRSEDGSEIRKVYDLSATENPAGISRSDFEQDGFHYTLIDLLKQELPENESRQHVETVSLESESKDMESVLALLPQEREFVTDDGLAGTLTLRLDSVKVEPSGYASSTRELTATRSYPNLSGQDTQYIPKTIEDNGRTLTLQNISWQTDNSASIDGYAIGERYTAVATYGGSTSSSYVTGYTVTADYSGTVSRIALNKTRYVAIFEGSAIEPVKVVPEIPVVADTPAQFNWAYVLVPLGIVAAVGGGVGLALFLKRRIENSEEDND